MTITYAYAGDIVKTEKQADGTLKVFGKATGPDLDSDLQICDPAWLAKAMPDWMKWANVREQHTSTAAGVGTVLEQDGNDWLLESLIVDAGSVLKVETGVYKGYSVGIMKPKIVKDAAAPGGRIVGGTIVEVSIVDRPANPTCAMAIAKMVGGSLVKAADGGALDDAVIGGNVETEAQVGVGEEPIETNVAAARQLLANQLVIEAQEVADGTGGTSPVYALAGQIDGIDYYVALDNADDAASSSKLAAAKAAFVKPHQEEIVKLSTIADLVKAASTGADEADKTAIADIRKTFGYDELELRIKAQDEKLAATETKATTAEDLARVAEQRLAKVEEMAAPGGPTRIVPPQPTADLSKAAKAREFRHLEATVTDRDLSREYGKRAADLEADL